jgi:hypothetical protein
MQVTKTEKLKCLHMLSSSRYSVSVCETPHVNISYFIVYLFLTEIPTYFNSLPANVEKRVSSE